MEHFTPGASLLGGAFIGLAASLSLLGAGRVAGISGIVGGLLVPRSGDTAWTDLEPQLLVFVPAMLAGMAIARALCERPEPAAAVAPPVGRTRRRPVPRIRPIVAIAVAAAVLAPGIGVAKPCGRGRGGPGCGMGAGGPADHMGFHYLLAHREQIRRAVTPRPDGVETVTESDDPAVVAGIRTHVRAMKARLEERRPIHARDPLFAAVFQHARAITMRIEDTAHGVRVMETSTDPWVADLIKAHAEVVNRFLANGFDEMHRDHAVPPRP